MSTYLDSKLATNLSEELSKIDNIPEHKLLRKVMLFIPAWVVKICKHYTNDFVFLEKNWQNLCNQWNTTPKEIIIVDFLPREQGFEDYKILEKFCNRLTKYGFVIRSHTELVPCEICKNAQITEQVYRHLTHLHSTHKEWNPICTMCMRKHVNT